MQLNKAAIANAAVLLKKGIIIIVAIYSNSSALL